MQQQKDNADRGSSRSEPKDQPWSRSGEGFARGLRYLACVAAGYLFGLAAGGAADPIPLPILAVVGAIGLWLVFSRGRASVANAAADAVAVANNRANAAAVAATNVTVAQGHVVQGSPPPIEAYDRAVFQGAEHLTMPPGARYIGADPDTGQSVYSLDGRQVTYDQLVRRQVAAAPDITTADADCWDPR